MRMNSWNYFLCVGSLSLLFSIPFTFALADGEWRDLGTLGGNYSYCTGVSADGRIIGGWSQTSVAFLK